MRGLGQTVVAAALLLGAAPATCEQQMRGLLLTVTAEGGARPGTLRARAVQRPPLDRLTGDPFASGATLLIGLLGEDPTRESFTLPAGTPPGFSSGWRVRRGRSGRGPTSFVYRDPGGRWGPVRLVRLQRTREAVRLEVRVALARNGLRPPDPGIAGSIALVVPGGETYCAGFGGPAGGRIAANDARRFRIGPTRSAACLPAVTPPAVVTFESGPVRTLALSPDGRRLFAVNTPDGRLESFDIDGAGGLIPRGAVPVGLEPVAVAARTDGEVWVVNHLSDSISIVDVSAEPPRVARTLLTCDEPRDLVFARGRAFVTAARRGQNCIGADGRPIDPLLTTTGVPRALVQVFDPDAAPDTLGGTPLAVVELFGDTPRALAVSPAGDTVYAAVFRSGNRTTTVHEAAVCDGGATAEPCSVGGAFLPGGLPFPNPASCAGRRQPETGLIVGVDATGAWHDDAGRDWSDAVRFTLPDLDVFALDVTATPPAQTRQWAGVGTVLFNMAVNPRSGAVYVSNTDANNRTRFEGERSRSCSASTVRGRLHEARITVLEGDAVLPRHLNPHLEPDAASPGGTGRGRSLATPLALATDGHTLWVAAFGSGAVAALDAAALEAGTFRPDPADHVAVSGGGPSGLALQGTRLYVTTRFDNGVSVIDTVGRREIAHVRLHDPEPASVTRGRPFLYDATRTSANGEASCAACHVFGDLDGLAWDLGDPDGAATPNPNPIELSGPPGFDMGFAPMKGPMTTQTLRGMAHHGPLHWRGDRTGMDPLNVHAAFHEFNRAFAALLGRDGPLADDEMRAFADFALALTPPPNPIRRLDGVLTPAERAGRRLYFDLVTDEVRTCNGCHVLDPPRGLFGTDGDSAFVREPQAFKIPTLRAAYDKVGMFGMPTLRTFRLRDDAPMGPQVRGFGYSHDGSVDTLARFLSSTVFTLSTAQASDLARFVFAYDTNLAPVVGQQVTLTAANAAAARPRIALLATRAAAAVGECDLVVHGVLDGVARGWVRLPTGVLASDRAAEPATDLDGVLAQAATPGQARTVTCAPPGAGVRTGIDRDADGCRDGDDPAPADATVGCGAR